MDGTTAALALGVREHADAKEIRTAFRALAKRTHPDVGGDPTEFSNALHAFAALSARCAIRSDERPPTCAAGRAINATHGFCSYDSIREARPDTRSFQDFLRVAIAKETSATLS